MLALWALVLATLWTLQAATYSNSKTVAAAGTRVTLLPTSTCAISYVVTAKIANAGTIYLGGPTVSASGVVGTPLTAGQSVGWLPQGSNCTYDLSLIYVDTTSSGDGVTFTYTR